MEHATKPQRVLIASANPLFGKGLQKLVQERWGSQAEVIGLTRSLDETLRAMETLQPDLVVVDYDDQSIHREEVLNHFVAGDRPMQVMLVSLRGGGSAVVYDRQTLSPSQAEDWFTTARAVEPARPVEPALPSTPEAKPARRNGMKHFVRIAFLIFISTAVIYYAMISLPLLPAAASAEAGPIDGLFRLHYIAIAFLFSLITMFMLYAIIVFRRKPGETGEGEHIHGSNRVEMVWTAMPILVVLIVSTIGAQNLAEVMRPDEKDPLVVNVTAGQWFWSYQYPDTGVVSSTLYVPVGREVLLRMTSRDVIHSFWVPEWRVKQDVLPGENLVKELRVTPSQVGEFKNRCAEMCGGAHAYMESPVVVMAEADFASWMTEQAAQVEPTPKPGLGGAVAGDPISRGRQISQDTGCIGCHSLDGSPSVGPTWLGLYEKEEQLEDGSTVVVDEAYLYDSIVDPQKQVVTGYPANMMPSYADTLTDEQINDIIEFIKSVK